MPVMHPIGRSVHKLEEIAPVTVVQGNRDWLFGMSFPRHISLITHGVRITLTHGHRSMLQYLFDKWAYIRIGYRFERYYRQLSADYPNSDVIIFGHTHFQTATWVNGQLFFNPGAAYPLPAQPQPAPIWHPEHHTGGHHPH
jgi:predicted phosphodiesterase